MGKRVRLWLMIAGALVLAGGIILGGVMTMLSWDFAKLSTDKYETAEYVISEDYKNISIITDTADIVFVPSENEKASVVCYEQENTKHSVAVKDGTLTITVADSRNWYDYIGINFGTPKITVSIPQGEYGTLSIKSSRGDVAIPKDFRFESITISESTGDVTNYASASEDIKIKSNTGSICVENVSANTLDLSVTTGRVTVSGVACEGDVKINVSTGKTSVTGAQCRNLTSDGNTGDLSLKNVIATEQFSIERSTGDVKLEGCDAAKIFVKTDTGDVTGSLLTDKVFITETDTGSVDVPQTATGGRCEITTDTGDIRVKVQQ